MSAGSSPDQLRKDFPLGTFPEPNTRVENPMVLVDSLGTILLWYLPNIISQAAMVGRSLQR